jgi:hypothetical protein
MKTVPCIRVGLAMLALAVGVEIPAATLGTAFTYQGRLQQAGGPASGLYDFQFSLWDANTAGAPVGALQTASAVGVTNGLFTVGLDFGSVFDGNARWLEIAVRTNGGDVFTTLAPRQALNPTPYTLFAANASALGGQSPGAFAPASGSAAYVAKAGDTMSGKLNLPVNGLSIGTTQLVVNGGLVGIGRPAPMRALDVADGTGPNHDGGIIHVGGTGYNGDAKVIEFGDPGLVFIGENGADDLLELHAARFFFNVGNVGILKANPATALDVAGTVTATGFSGPGTGLTGIPTTGLADNSVTAAKLASDANSLSKVSAGSMSLSGGAFSLTVNEYLNDRDIYLRSDNFHGLGWAGAGKLFANRNDNGPALYGADGGVLGTTSGGQQWALSWNKDANVTAHGALSLDNGNANTGSVNRAALTFGAGSGEGIASKRNAGGNQAGLDFYTSFNTRLSIDNTGNLMLRGNTWMQSNPLYLRDYNTSQDGLGYFGPANPLGGIFAPDGPILFGSAGGLLMTRSGGDKVALSWDNQQRVGIGKTSPTTALDVNGTVTATSFSGSSYSGNGSGLSSVNADTLDGLHGSAYLNAGNLNAGTLSDLRLSGNVALLSANQAFSGVNTFAGAVGIGTTTPFAALLDVEGDIRLNAHELYLFPGNDNFHGLGFYGGTKPFAGVNVNGPVLYGFGGGALGTTGTGQLIALAWNSSGNVGIGKANPATTLDVNGEVSAPTVTVTSQLRLTGPRTVLSGWDDTSSHWFGPSPDSDLAFGIRRVGVNDYDFTLKGNFYGVTFNPTSDRNAKENFQPVNPQTVLEKVAALPISEWNFKGDASTPHIGPMAQDFHAAFGIGPDDKHIATVDADGVALAAIQGLNQKLEAKNAGLEKQVAELRALVETLAAKVNGGGQ